MKTILDSLYTSTRSFVSKISVLLILIAFPTFLTAQNVLFVVGDTLLDPGDQIIALSLQNEPGLSLEIKDDDGIQSSAANGKDLVLISSTTSAGKIGTTFTNTPTIVSCYNRELYDELGMVAPGGTGTVYESSIHLSDPATPWWLKLFPIQVTNSTHPFTYATINGNATMHSHVPGNTSQALSFTYPSGSQMYGMTAPADRVGLFIQDAYASLIDLTTLGQTLLQASFGLTNPIQVEETNTFMKLYAPADTGLLRSGHGFQTSSGDYMIIGAGMSTDTIDNNFLLLELDDQGNQTAAHHFQTTALKEAVDTEFNVHNVAHTTDGDIVFVTQTRSAIPPNYPGPPDIGAAIIRLDENRNVKFLKTVSNSFFATPLALKATNDNGVVLLGYMPGGGLVYQKIDNQGVDVWEYTISESKKPKDLHIYPDGKMALIANENSNSYFMSFDASGSWTSEIELQTSGMDDFELFAMEVLADSNLLLTGRARVNGKDMMPIIHISPQGVILDKRLISLGSYGDMRGTALVANPDGGFAVAGGVIDPFQSSKEKPFLIRFKDNLDLIEMQVYETFDHQANKHVATTDVELTSDWGYLITASQGDREYWKTTYGPLNHNGDGFPLLIKTDAKGQLKTPNDCKYTSFDNSNVSSYVLSSAGGSLGDITGVPVSYGQNPSSSKTVTTNPDLTYTEISLSSSVTNPQACPMQLPECPTVSLEFMTPAASKNYIATYTPRVAVSLVSTTPGLPIDAKTELQKLDYAHELVQAITYLDGLGRPEQQIAPQSAADGSDIISFSVYDGFGRMPKEYMPYESLATYGDYQNSPQSDQQSFYSSKFPTYGTTRLFTEHQYEPSQRSREVETAAPGVPWETKSSTTFGQREAGEHTVITSYDLNAAGEVHFIPLDVTPGTNLSATYAPGELSKTTTTDENDGISETFTDKMGKNILTRVQIEGSEYAETYYGYDKYGNILYVIPPEATKAIFETGNDALSQTILDSWCFQYEYDERNRVARKKVPGAGWVELIYNKLDQLVLTQDANQTLDNEWLYTKYDAFARPIETGIYTSSNAKSVLEGQIDGASLFEVRQSGNDGYSNNAFPTSNTEKLSITYYDDYDFDRDGSPDHLYEASGTNEKSRGFITGVKTKVLDSSPEKWLLTLTFYDDYGREIETRSEHLHGTDITKYQLNFIGEIEKNVMEHNGPNSTAITQTREYCYDHNGRMLRVTSQVNSDAPIVLSSYEYDVLGRQATKKLHSKDGLAYLQNVDYSYNIRGWMTAVNEVATADDLFELTLAYNDNTIEIGGAGADMFNGNIAGMSWKTALDNETHSYSFIYDKLNRLEEANYGAGSSYGINPNRYNVDLSYDRNGNILSLNRKGKDGASSFGNMDFLDYEYGEGNQLKKVTDNGQQSAIADVEQFVDGSNDAEEYLYDANGNITEDKNKGISIEYNHLNKPTLITKGSNTITYVYDAAGTKLQQIVNDGTTKTNDYINGMHYENSSIQFLQHEEGRLVPDGTIAEYRYEFTLNDHLGNARVSFSDLNDDGVIQTSTEVLQTDHYYPFGMRMAMDGNIDPALPNKYLYNGKELQTDLDINWYDYGARMYDASIARWNEVDALADRYANWSSYNYVLGNPIRLVDPDGRRVSLFESQANQVGTTDEERQRQTGEFRTEEQKKGNNNRNQIAILSDPTGAGGAGHAAVLIGNESKGYYLFSKNGTNRGIGFRGPNDKGDQRGTDLERFNSIEEFANSDFNFDDETGAPIYTRGYLLETNANFSTLRNAAISILDEDYHLTKSSCIDVCSAVLSAGNFDPGFDYYRRDEGYTDPSTPFKRKPNDAPNVRYEDIIKNNPGTDISKRLLPSAAIRERKLYESKQNQRLLREQEWNRLGPEGQLDKIQNPGGINQ